MFVRCGKYSDVCGVRLRGVKKEEEKLRLKRKQGVKQKRRIKPKKRKKDRKIRNGIKRKLRTYVKRIEITKDNQLRTEQRYLTPLPLQLYPLPRTVTISKPHFLSPVESCIESRV